MLQAGRQMKADWWNEHTPATSCKHLLPDNSFILARCCSYITSMLMLSCKKAWTAMLPFLSFFTDLTAIKRCCLWPGRVLGCHLMCYFMKVELWKTQWHYPKWQGFFSTIVTVIPTLHYYKRSFTVYNQHWKYVCYAWFNRRACAWVNDYHLEP